MGKTLLLIPEIDAIIVALCADYERRVHAIGKGGISYRVEMEYKYLNYKIFEGAAEIVGEDDALAAISDIGNRIGYARADGTEVCERTYKRRKQKIKHSIAKKLMLCD